MIVHRTIAILVMSLVCWGSAQAATLVVTSPADSGAGTLREALANANNGDRIILDALSSSITVFSTLNVYDQVQIIGNGNTVGSTGAGSGVRIFTLNSVAGGTTITGLAIVSGEYGVSLQGPGCTIYNCRVGTDWADSSSRGNGSGILVGAADQRIGLPGIPNIISGNVTYGIYCTTNTERTIIQNNWIGLSSSGTALPNSIGVSVDISARQVFIGGDVTAANNVISGNTNQGIYIGTFGNTVAGNFIGVSANGTAAVPNNIGVEINNAPGGNTIGLADSAYYNVIAGNTTRGIHNYMSARTVIRNNFIGKNDLNQTLPNGEGIRLQSSSGCMIGGYQNDNFYHRNVISGNSNNGIYVLPGSNGNTISGNYIGVDNTGTTYTANGTGIYMMGSYNLIGGYTADSDHKLGNIISGNATYGYRDSSGIGNSMVSNFVGLNATGTAAIANLYGVTTGNQTLVGGIFAGYRNVIAGNWAYGVYFSGAVGSTVTGNYIGVGADGSTVIPNGGAGVCFNLAHGNLLGGLSPAERNIICGNSLGVFFRTTSYGNTVVGNWLGVTAGQTAAAIALTHGVYFYAINAPFGNTIGLPSANLGNLIVGTNTAGIFASGAAADYNTWFGNTICGFSGAGIDLNNDGANDDKAAPVINAGNLTSISGTSGNNDAIQVFLADRGTGLAGGSLRLLGTTTSDGGGNWSFTPTGLSWGDVVCAIATDTVGNSSEFSYNYQLVPVGSSPTFTPTTTWTPAMTLTPTSTQTGTPTPSATPTITRTRTVSPTVTLSATGTSTGTVTPTPTLTPVVSPTPTLTRSATFTATATITLTQTASPTDTPAGSGTLNDRDFLTYPNPAQDRVHFQIRLATAGRVTIVIYNLNGETAAKLSGNLPAGVQIMVWECRNHAPGIYLARILVEGQEKAKVKVALW